MHSTSESYSQLELNDPLRMQTLQSPSVQQRHDLDTRRFPWANITGSSRVVLTRTCVHTRTCVQTRTCIDTNTGTGTGTGTDTQITYTHQDYRAHIYREEPWLQCTHLLVPWNSNLCCPNYGGHYEQKKPCPGYCSHNLMDMNVCVRVWERVCVVVCVCVCVCLCVCVWVCSST